MAMLRLMEMYTGRTLQQLHQTQLDCEPSVAPDALPRLAALPAFSYPPHAAPCMFSHTVQHSADVYLWVVQMIGEFAMPCDARLLQSVENSSSECRTALSDLLNGIDDCYVAARCTC